MIFLSLHFQLKMNFGDVKEKYLSEYCFSGTYIISLLQEGYHFTPDNWKTIHFMGQVLIGFGGGWVVVIEAALDLKEVGVNLI